MLIYPAIDLYGGKAVRLYKGDYAQMTVYSDDPASVAADFKAKGAERIHLVDLEGAKSGETPNLETVLAIRNTSGLFCEIGGGIRSMEVIDRYLGAGIDRVILGTAAVTGFVAIKGWTEKSELEAMDFTAKMQAIGVKTLICTDISRDGAMQGANHALYKELSEKFDMQIIASGGVSSIDDIKRLRAMDIHGAIIGKAYYTGAVDLAEAIEVAK